MTITAFSNRTLPSISLYEHMQLDTNWDDVTCPICLDFPHNGVLLKCSSSHKGCQPFMCDTDHTHSNCLNRFKNAYKIAPKDPSTSNWSSGQVFDVTPSSPDSCPSCPLCRGHVTGWVVNLEARMYLDMKERYCAEKNCSFIGNYFELKEHTQSKHPHSRPSEIDPARQLDWENFQQSTAIVDVLSTIHAEVPHGVVLGDYVIEYGSDDNGADEYEEFNRREGKWWSSCIFSKVFSSFRNSRNRGNRSRSNSSSSNSNGTRRERNRSRSSSDGSSIDEGSPTILNSFEYRIAEMSGYSPRMDSASGSRGVASRSSQAPVTSRQRSRFYDT